MAFPRRLRTLFAQLFLDNSHCHQAILPHDRIPPTSNVGSYRPRRRHGYDHDYGRYTCKAAFSTMSARSRASSREPTLYEVLDIPVTATPAEIKKKFYALSLAHHPDRNPNDPSASSRFARISSAYQTLSNSTKRSTYDRDHGIHSRISQSTHSTATPGQHPMGSHSSHGASYFGSRPASGLSKRRGVFKGPPPSFYTHGGYGSNRARRAGGLYSAGSGTGGGSGGAAGGTGKDDDPTGFIDRNPISHFNARGHYRTQTAEDVRRQERRSRVDADINEQYIGGRGDFTLRFIAVSGILLGAGALAGFLRWPSAGGSGSEKSRQAKYSRVKDG
ncbi:DnaJ domain-containing protein [Aspergillus desertorum]